jgi:hypothetical protein
VVVVGVHTPEFARERVPANVAAASRRLGVTYPVALDNGFAIWRAFRNQYWPSVYIADRAGRVRFHHFGEDGTPTPTAWSPSCSPSRRRRPPRRGRRAGDADWEQRPRVWVPRWLSRAARPAPRASHGARAPAARRRRGARRGRGEPPFA